MSELLDNMNELLEQINASSDNDLQRAERSCVAINDILRQVKQFICGYTFTDAGEEILFFKEIKVQFLRELLYHSKIFYIEEGKPIGNQQKQTDYYNTVADSINAYFEKNHTFYIYYKMGRSDKDGRYFIREAEPDELLPDYSLDNDSLFSNPYSLRLAKIQAYEQVNDYLKNALYKLEHPEITVHNEKQKHGSLWTDTKAALIELAYAIHSRGAVNNGKGDVKHLITELEVLFNVQVGNFYRTFQSMRIRKKSRTPFLDTLKDSLERRMDDTDLNYT